MVVEVVVVGGGETRCHLRARVPPPLPLLLLLLLKITYWLFQAAVAPALQS